MIARAVSTAVPLAEPQGAVLRYARWGLYLTVAALPLYTVRWHYGPLPTTLTETLILATVGLYVAGRWRDGLRRPLATPFDIAIIALLVAGVIAVLVADDRRAALGLYRAYFLEPVALFYVAVDLIRRESDVKGLILSFAIGSSAFALLNLGVFTKALLDHRVFVGNAPNALYGDANYVAMYLEPPFAFAAGLLMIARSRPWRLLGAAWLLLTGAALVLTFSKGAYLALLVLVAVIVITAPRWGAAAIGGLVAAVIATSQVPLLMARLATVQSSLDGRSEMFTAGLAAIQQHPVFGVGLGGYDYKFRHTMSTIYPHNIWLTFWVEVGILGLAAFAFVYLTALWRGWTLWRPADGFWKPVVWGIVGAFVLWFAHGMVDSPYWKNDMSVEFWMLVALVLVAERAIRRPAPQEAPVSTATPSVLEPSAAK